MSALVFTVVFCLLWGLATATLLLFFGPDPVEECKPRRVAIAAGSGFAMTLLAWLA